MKTLLDIALELPDNRLERAINEADKREVIDPKSLREALKDHAGEPGIRPLGPRIHWPDLGLVVETDGWRYHRTPAAQTRDALRFQTHTAARLTPLRFSHWQVKYEPRHVLNILRRTATRLRGSLHPH